MKRFLSLALALVFCLAPLAVSAEPATSISQKTVLGALNVFLQKHAPGTAFPDATGANLKFSRELFFNLFNAELGDVEYTSDEDGEAEAPAENKEEEPALSEGGKTPPSDEAEETNETETNETPAPSGTDKNTAAQKSGPDLSQSATLTCSWEAPAGKTPANDELAKQLSRLKLGSLIQYGKGGHIAFYLGELDEDSIAVLDCGFASDDLIRLRIVKNADLKQVAKEKGLLFFRYKELPDNFGSENVALNLLQKPAKTEYFVGEDPSAEGARFEYVVGTQKAEFNHEREELAIYASTAEAGKTPVLFLYDGALAFCTLEVLEQTVEKLEVKQKPKKLSYSTEETLDMTGAKIVATKLDGTKLTLNGTDYTTEYDFTLGEAESSAEKTVRILYCGKTCEFTVTVTRPSVSNVRVFLTKTEYFIGEPLKYDDAYILFDTDSKKDQRADLDFSMLGTVDTSTAGEKTVVVTYRGATATVTVTYLEKEIVTVALKTKLNERYRTGSKLDLDTIELIVTFEDSTTAIVTARDCEVSINGVETNELTEAGINKIVFTYRGVSTAEESVTVIREEESSSFLPWLILILVILLVVPAAVLLTLYFVRKKQANASPAAPAEQTDAATGTEAFPLPDEIPEAEEELVASFDELEEEEEDEDADMRVAEEKNLPKVEFLDLKETPQDEQGLTRKIDFFDDL